eukprot:XP_001703294.1 predicted protein [Chlamydomonas reinhardtii]
MAGAEDQLGLLNPGLLRNIAGALHPNEVASSFKFANKEVLGCLRDDYRTFNLARKPSRWCSSIVRGVGSPPSLAEQPWPGHDFVAHWGRPEPWRALNRRQRHRLLCLAASSLHPPSLDAALAHCGTVVKADALVSAAAVGELEACRRLLVEEGCHWDTEPVWAAAAMNGHVAVCRWLGEIGMYGGEVASTKRFVVKACCFSGQREVLAYMQTEVGRGWGGEPLPAELATAAAEGGQVELLGELLAAAAVTGAMQCCEVLAGVAYGCPSEVLQHYYGQWGTEAAAEAQHRQALLLRAATSPTGDWAAKCDWLLLRMLLAMMGRELSRPPAPPQVLATAAAAAGQVPVLRILRAEGVAFSYVQNLKAALELPLPFNELLVNERPFECLPALRYLLMEGGGLEEAEATEAAAAAEDGEEEEESAVDWSAVLRHAAQRGSDLALLRHLHEQHGAAINFEELVAGGSEEQLEWALGVLGPAGVSSQASGVALFRSALVSGNWAAAEWLRSRGLAVDPDDQQQLQQLFCSLAAEQDTPLHIPALWWLLQRYSLQWTPECRDALDVCQEIAWAGGWPVAAGHSQWMQEMMQMTVKALAAL